MHYDCINFISYASYSNPLENRSIFDQKSKFPWHWTSKIGDFNWKELGRITGQEYSKKLENVTVDHWPSGRPVEEPVDRFVGVGNLKGPRASVFFSLFSAIPQNRSSSRLQRSVWVIPRTDLRFWSVFWRDFEARVSSLDGFGLRIWTGCSLFARHLLVLLISRTPRVSWD